MIRSFSCFKVLALTIVSILSRSTSFVQHSFPYSKLLYKTQLYSSTSTENEKELLLKEIKLMKATEVKAELRSRGVSTKDVFERDELNNRLVKARLENSAEINTDASTPPTSNTESIQIPLEFLALDAKPIKTVDNTNQETYLRPSPGKFVTVTLYHPPSSQSVKMLVDTACTGVVLSPHAASRKLKLQMYNTPVTMTAAGGNSVQGSVAQLDTFVLGKEEFGPLPVAVQAIDALPDTLDGIIGLSFLSQFSMVEFDFPKKSLILYKTKYSTSSCVEGDIEIKSLLRRTRMGIFTTNLYLDKKYGPIKLLLDTGSASTILNWNGVTSGLSLSKMSNEIQAISNPIGAMGADNVAFALTHRFTLSNNIGFTLSESLEIKKDICVDLDIGDLPIFDTLAIDGVGGILGMDVLMNCCDVLCMRLNYQDPFIKLIQRKT